MTPETELKKSIKQYFNAMHIDWFYNLQGLGGYKGIPDLCFFHPKTHELIFLEIKTPKGILSDYQIKFKTMCESHKQKYLVIRSTDELINLCK